jgi:hypothetical protein
LSYIHYIFTGILSKKF